MRNEINTVSPPPYTGSVENNGLNKIIRKHYMEKI
jgi:hypothetical protein